MQMQLVLSVMMVRKSHGLLAGCVLCEKSTQVYSVDLYVAGIRFGGDGNSEPNSNPSTWDYQLAQVQPVLLNKQDDTSFSLANTSPQHFSRRVQINTVGGKGSIRIKVSQSVTPAMYLQCLALARQCHACMFMYIAISMIISK